MIRKTILLCTLLIAIWWIQPIQPSACNKGETTTGCCNGMFGTTSKKSITDSTDQETANDTDHLKLPKKGDKSITASTGKKKDIVKSGSVSQKKEGDNKDGRFNDTEEEVEESDDENGEISKFWDNFINKNIKDVPVSVYTAAAMKAADTGYPWYINIENKRRKLLREPNLTEYEANKMIEEFKQFRMDYEKKLGRSGDTEIQNKSAASESTEGRKQKINLKPQESIGKMRKKGSVSQTKEGDNDDAAKPQADFMKEWFTRGIPKVEGGLESIRKDSLSKSQKKRDNRSGGINYGDYEEEFDREMKKKKVQNVEGNNDPKEKDWKEDKKEEGEESSQQRSTRRRRLSGINYGDYEEEFDREMKKKKVQNVEGNNDPKEKDWKEDKKEEGEVKKEESMSTGN